MPRATYILRIVERGVVAVNYDPPEMDLDVPCDLVILATEVIDDGDGLGEVELDRKEFETGHAASRYMGEMMRAGKETD